MSAHASSSSSSSSAAPRFSQQPGHFHGPPMPRKNCREGGDDEGKQQESASATGAASAGSKVQLYRHALESIFTFLNRAGLAVVLCVSRAWQSAVGSMRSIGARRSVTPDALLQLTTSRLRRHVTEVDMEELTTERVDLMHLHLPHMLMLCASETTLSVDATPRWPSRLQSLELGRIQGDAVQTKLLLQSIGELSQLRSVVLDLNYFLELSFAPFASLSLLRSFTLWWRNSDFPSLSHEQVNQFRLLAGVEEFAVPMSDESTLRLLRLPHTLRWQRVVYLSTQDLAVHPLLPNLSSLTQLHVVNHGTYTHYDFLPRMRSVTQLTVAVTTGHPAADITTDALMEALKQCPKITSLSLFAPELPLTSEKLAACLATMPALAALEISEARLHSLSFLALSSLALSLRELSLRRLRQPRLDPSELRHLHGLHSLRGLTLDHALPAPLDADTRALYQPPSLLLPLLESFEYTEVVNKADAGPGTEAAGEADGQT